MSSKEYLRQWKQKNKDKIAQYRKNEQKHPNYANRIKQANLRKSFGMTLEQYNKLFEKQDGKCACCGVHQLELDRALAVDHCHETKMVRGLLCNRCNRVLGMVEDNVEILKNLSEYVENNLATDAESTYKLKVVGRRA